MNFNENKKKCFKFKILFDSFQSRTISLYICSKPFGSNFFSKLKNAAQNTNNKCIKQIPNEEFKQENMEADI